MKELTRKLEYESAHTCRVAVEVEQTFCGSVEVDIPATTHDDAAVATKQPYTEYNGGTDFEVTWE